jgi:dimethylargininase
VDRARNQHTAYETALRGLGCEVIQLPGDGVFPDCVFIEDTAVVFDEIAVIAHPGAESRRGETEAVAQALSQWRDLANIDGSAVLDGGDVLVADKVVYVGMSSRSNAEGAEQLKALLAPFGYQVQPMPMNGCLHLKSAASVIGDDTVLINPAWCDAGSFDDHRIIEVDPAEPHAANVLRIGDTLLVPVAFPATRQRLVDAGFNTITVPADELAKAEAGLTCCSLIFKRQLP